MRIKSKTDIQGLGMYAQQKLAKELEKTKKKGKDKRLEDVPRFCEYPTKNPAFILHIALEKKYKHINNGGVFVQELILPNSKKAYRYDFAILHAKLLIEFDGWGCHHRKENFKRDRQKQRIALIENFVQFNVSNEMVKFQLDELMDDIDKIVNIRPRFEIPTIYQKGNQFHVYGSPSVTE